MSAWTATAFATFGLNARDGLLGLLIALIVVHHDNGAIFGQSLPDRSTDPIVAPVTIATFPLNNTICLIPS